MYICQFSYSPYTSKGAAESMNMSKDMSEYVYARVRAW